MISHGAMNAVLEQHGGSACDTGGTGQRGASELSFGKQRFPRETKGGEESH